MNTKLIELLGNTNKTFMKALQDMHSEIMTIPVNESTDVQRLESQSSAQKIAMSSEIGTLQSELHKLKYTLFGTFFGKFLNVFTQTVSPFSLVPC